MPNKDTNTLSRDKGTLVVLFNSYKNLRLPRARTIKNKLDNGDVLNDFDIKFLNSMLDDAHHLLSLQHENPEIGPILEELFSFYDNISKEALYNEEQLHNLAKKDIDFPLH